MENKKSDLEQSVALTSYDEVSKPPVKKNGLNWKWLSIAILCLAAEFLFAVFYLIGATTAFGESVSIITAINFIFGIFSVSQGGGYLAA